MVQNKTKIITNPLWSKKEQKDPDLFIYFYDLGFFLFIHWLMIKMD